MGRSRLKDCEESTGIYRMKLQNLSNHFIIIALPSPKSFLHENEYIFWTIKSVNIIYDLIISVQYILL